MKPNARREKLIVKDLGGDTVVYDEATSEAHELNRTAALVWRHCDGQKSVADLARIVGEETALPADEGVVGLAIAQLTQAGLLEQSEGAAVAAISRRQLVGRLGAAAALLLPAVTTVVAPTSAMAQSGPIPPTPFPTTGAPTPFPTTAAPTNPPPTNPPTTSPPGPPGPGGF